MRLVGLTGGIGAGKSTVSAALAARGAVVVDADQVARDVQAPGSAVLARMAERFGAQVIDAEGALDRAAVAAIVFSDPEALAALNSIVHPAIGAEMNRRVLEQASTDRLVVMDVPLLTENPREGLQGIIVVDVPVEVQVQRLVEGRGFSDDDARARIARQASREQRLASATIVVDNSGSLDDLAPQIDRVWAWVEALPQLSAEQGTAGVGRRADGVDRPA
ncbi:MAG: dephospho-CoA kinase [Ilumatobacteraceae bacterium]